MSTDNALGSDNGHGGQPGSLLQAGRLGRFAGTIRAPAVQGTRPAGLTDRHARREPEAPGSWPRFLLKHACWILVVTIAALAGARLLLHSQTRVYKAQASVVVQPPGTPTSTLQAPDMATEKGIVSSNVVLTIASRALHVPTGQLFNGLSATSPGSTYLLNISYSSSNPYTAQQRAQAIAQAYVTYRTPKPAPERKGKKTTTPAVTTTPTATLITPALVPISPSSPKPALDYSLAVLVGLSLGIGTAAIRDRLNDRLRGPADLEALTAAPILGLVPAFWSAGRKPARLVMLSRPGSVVADAYRGLRTRIVQAAAPPGATVLTVAGPAREDKEAVAANLAVALAQAGWPTVLVCADLRWGQAHRLFGLEETMGLSGLLDRRTHLEKALVATGVPGLQLLPAGPPPLDTGAMLQRPAFCTLLSALEDRADFVVLVAPPILASADAGLLADLAEITLLVADARRSTRAQVRAAMRELMPTRDHTVGCVLTGAGRRRLLRRSRIPVPTGHGTPAVAPPGNDGRAGGPEPVLSPGEGGSRPAGARPEPHQTPPVTADTPETEREDDQ